MSGSTWLIGRRGPNRRVYMGEQPGGFVIVTRRILRPDENFEIHSNQKLIERLGKRVLETVIAFSSAALDDIHSLHKELTGPHSYTVTVLSTEWKERPLDRIAHILRRMPSWSWVKK